MDDRIQKKIKEIQLNYAFINLCNIFDLKHKKFINDQKTIVTTSLFLNRFWFVFRNSFLQKEKEIFRTNNIIYICFFTHFNLERKYKPNTNPLNPYTHLAWYCYHTSIASIRRTSHFIQIYKLQKQYLVHCLFVLHSRYIRSENKYQSHI